MALSPYGCFSYTFAGTATAEQRRWFTGALAGSLFEFSRISAHVDVEFAADPSVHLHNEAAVTTWDVPVLQYTTATMKLKADLAADQVRHAHHELGHVVQSRMNTDMRDRMAALFQRDGHDGDADHWKAADYDTGTGTWRNSIQEAFAEEFTVIYLPKELGAGVNRSAWTLPKSRRPRFFAILDEMCCPVIES